MCANRRMKRTRRGKRRTNRRRRPSFWSGFGRGLRRRGGMLRGGFLVRMEHGLRGRRYRRPRRSGRRRLVLCLLGAGLGLGRFSNGLLGYFLPVKAPQLYRRFLIDGAGVGLFFRDAHFREPL